MAETSHFNEGGMKKTLISIVLAVAVLSLAACGIKPAFVEPPHSTAPAATPRFPATYPVVK
jgi:predicted small lipoprotein YifL